MKCPNLKCGTWTRVLETRDKPENQTYRRYECANGHKFSTLEQVAQFKRGRKLKEPV